MSEIPPTLTAVILTKNEQEMIANCLETVRWCDEIIVVDQQSTDSTVDLVKQTGAKVFVTDLVSFAQRRELGLQKSTSDWILYLDADERVTKQVKLEIERVMSLADISAVEFQRQNIHYGKWFRAGGWQDDWVPRLFKKSALLGWEGQIHEGPKVKGKIIRSETALVHLTHRNVLDGLEKSLHWTPMEAQLLFEAKVPQVTVLTLLRKSLMEFLRRLILKKGYQDGIEGWIEAMVQGYNKFLVYVQLWELQRKPTLNETYQRIDEKILSAWKTLEEA